MDQLLLQKTLKTNITKLCHDIEECRKRNRLLLKDNGLLRINLSHYVNKLDILEENLLNKDVNY
jgi:hypothetical protein